LIEAIEAGGQLTAIEIGSAFAWWNDTERWKERPVNLSPWPTPG
jgi:hypothetical protein